MSFAVHLRDRPDMHVAGLMLARALERAAKSGKPAPTGNVAVDAGGMAMTILPSSDGVEVACGRVPPIAASIAAPLGTLLDLCGGASVIRAILLGGLRVHGSPRALLALRALLRAPEARP